MKLFSSIWGMFGSGGAGQRNPANDYWWSPSNQPDLSTAVNAQTVVQIPEVYACLNVISQTIGSLPLLVYRRHSDGSKERLNDFPIARVLGVQANELIASTAFEFRAQMTWDLALHRNAFAEIISGRNGPVSELVRIDPCNVEIVKGTERGDYVYEVRDGARKRRLLREDVFHLRLSPLTSDGLMGRSLIRDGYRTFQRALAIEDYGRPLLRERRYAVDGDHHARQVCQS